MELDVVRFSEFHNKTIAILRSRAEYTGDDLNFKLNSNITITSDVVNDNALAYFDLSFTSAAGVHSLSLIHISEPTRPY